MGKKKKT